MHKVDGELSDEELEQVVGGSRKIKISLERRSRYVKESVSIKVPALLRPKEELNSKLWGEDKRLHPDVRERLLEIAEKFIKPTLGSTVTIKDITFTGSLANYNYSDMSDIDLHIIIDFADVNKDKDLVKRYFNAVKALWNSLHDIRIKGFEVEAYVQDESEPHTSTGVYSVQNDTWLKEPAQTDAEIDEDSVTNKANSLIDQIEQALKIFENGDHEGAMIRAESLMEKIKKLRKAGLETDGEYSIENLAFKTLRNTGYLLKLSDLKREAYDAMMSIEEKKKGKDDRCTRIAKRKYDVWPSAYASGAVVKCRQGKIWKGLSEELELTDKEIQLLKKIKDQLANSAKKHSKVAKMSTDSSNLHKKQVDQIDDLIDEKTDYSKEKKSGLHGWFSRQGGKGKSKGWVDCNTCRKDKKTGKKTCKSCGRKEGEKRAKYPSCRPTPSACGTKGKGKKWGKKSEGINMRLTDELLRGIIFEELEELTENYFHIVDATYDDGSLAEDIEFWDDVLSEAEYQGRKVQLNKPMRGDVKKFKVYVKDPKTGNVKKVNFGDPNMRIKKSNPKRRKSFRARHNCDNPGPKTKARYWSCRKW